MNTGSVLVVGGRSDIGLAIARRFAVAGYEIRLAARNSVSLEANRADLTVRYGVEASIHELDVLDTASFAGFLDSLPNLPDVVISVVGLLGDQAVSQNDAVAAAQVMRTNFEGPALLLGVVANRFEARGHGVIVGISSVAGDRGRASNYVYGSAKAGFTAFLSGLRNRLAQKNVHVLTVLPGFVATRMTEGMDLKPALTATPDQVAEQVFKAVRHRKDRIYVKPVWWLVMSVIRNIPEAVFKKTKL